MLPLLFFTPFIFAAFIWLLITSYRLLRPEEPGDVREMAVVKRRKARAQGVAVPVGARDIRDDLVHDDVTPASVRQDIRLGLVPKAWIEDLNQRKN
ncbi:MAG: hypothetical protein EB075_08480 [Bacteroidetes bacterium]|nr:hypothetical protein [Bacteroidota bacterium]